MFILTITLISINSDLTRVNRNVELSCLDEDVGFKVGWERAGGPSDLYYYYIGLCGNKYMWYIGIDV